MEVKKCKLVNYIIYYLGDICTFVHIGASSVFRFLNLPIQNKLGGNQRKKKQVRKQ